MSKSIRNALLGLLLCAAVPAAHAQDVSRQQMRSLDEQVQEIKSDVLGIATELSQLEEKLLYPSNTQLAIFVTLADEQPFRLDAVQIAIDGQPVAHYIYSFKELEALQQGGVQRIYTGNVATGDHRLDVSVAGKLASGKDHIRSESFTFVKGVEPKLLGLEVAGSDSGNSGIQLGNW